MDGKRTMRVAAAQLPGLPLNLADKSLSLIEQAVADAAGRGAELLVMPECAYPAYHLGSLAAYRSSAVLDSDKFLDQLRGLAASHRIHLVCGFVEETATALHNTAVVIDSAGIERGRQRKTFLWGDDNVWFRPGDRIAPIEMPFGKMGVIICADGRAPEIAAGLVAQGAELIAVPTCWINAAERPGQYANVQAEFMLLGRVLECRVPFVAADKFGQETTELSYCGWSMIVDAEGRRIVQAPPDEAAMIDASVTIRPPVKRTVADWTVRRLFSDYPPVLPDVASLGPVKIAVAPAGLVESSAADGGPRVLLERLLDQGVQIVGTSLSGAEEAEQLDVYARVLGMVVVGFPFVERLMFEQFGAFGCVASDHVYSFAACRAMALDGASILFVTGDPVPLELLRTRAAENRLFVAASSRDTAQLIAPSGKVIDSVDTSDSDAIVAEVDLRESAVKQVYLRTDIWEQRRPDVYAAAFAVQRGVAHFV